MSELAIDKIDVFRVELPYSGGVYTLSGGREYRSFDATIVRITTDNGLEGWGESTPFGSTYIASHAFGVRAGIAEIAPHLLGRDPRRVDRINDAMDQALLGHEHAKTALDVACWDIFGKAVGMPVCDLLGGRTDARMPVISSIYMGDPEDMRRRVAEHRARGYIGHSVKIGGDPAEDAARIAASLADKRPGEFFIVDANGGMSVETALRMLRLLPHGLDFVLEAPCATWRECLSLRRRTDVPIIFDELALSDASIIQLIADDAAEGIGLKISKNGGLTRGRRHRDICLAAGYTVSVQETTGSDIAFAAIVHLGQTVPERQLRCLLECRDMVSLKTADGAFGVEAGHVRAPNGPGLGVTPRLDVLGAPVASYQR
ncbi:mandelate racemase/muconate lactonizing enzyme family protein [Paracoccus sp. P2]|uniref:Mandelate racemase/muconate lactonizing enzyme family protein n=1 Tax=Paracoccus pantotrophus TaxID=82367 RepID=A0A7H9C025_PARPN|nr:mandelate racemase/muconate lactonizing enzyme family protein [Paracoccus pantotrophus]MDF3855287.1 mandelate racemase/muconate lactonizing enzyme family protein [Paracoccus pantotrophus]QLH16967.1 mandelate racemase/muconate lactonizing enzyme family protein [Paracoccus pantotrophus]RDD95172.1 mandelate racemase [Paracoccus pantotrophus]RNI15355.1 mandelate racemase [Paracoccus pantotrophus]WGR65870.1 mandelate racemase [Paracoccus pantotrophus]